MIKSLKQYKITQKRLDDFRAAISAFDFDENSTSISSSARKAAYDALVSLRDELETSLREFEQIRDVGVSAVAFERLVDLPRALVQTRIARRMTQKDLADALDVTSQQVQRWERDDYEKTGLAYVIEIGQALGFDEVINESRAVVGANYSQSSRDLNVATLSELAKTSDVSRFQRQESVTDRVRYASHGRSLSPSLGVDFAQLAPLVGFNLVAPGQRNLNEPAVAADTLNHSGSVTRGQNQRTLSENLRAFA